MARRRFRSKGTQKGFAALLALTVIVLSAVWFTIAAASKALSFATEREQRTGIALQKAKQALLAYVAASAASSTESSPGRIPCPEVRSQVGTGNEGVAGPFAGIACDAVGRLPWRTLGVDVIRDGYGEPLWYAVPSNSTWAKINTTDTLVINPGTTNQLTYDGVANSVVAVIIAAGEPINKAGTPPAGCTALSQNVATRQTALVVTNFLECGNATGSYRSAPTTNELNVPGGEKPWKNDRTIAITASEVMTAIAGAVNDRMQRQVAPALESWRTTESLANWGRSFMPYASSFSFPTTDDLCGNNTVVEGLPPTAKSASSTCSSWSSGTVTSVTGTVGAPSCVQAGTEMTCTFTAVGLGLFGTFNASISVTAPSVASSFRAPITAASITTSPGLTVSAPSSTLSQATGNATVSFSVSTFFLYALTPVTVHIPNLPDAAILSDARVAWFVNNGWDRYTYYAISTAVDVNPGASVCPVTGGPACLTLANLPASNGLTNDKNFVLTYMGEGPVTTTVPYVQTRPSSNAVDYLESHTVGTTTYTMSNVNSNFNDRLSGCPFKQTPTTGAVTIC